MQTAHFSWCSDIQIPTLMQLCDIIIISLTITSAQWRYKAAAWLLFCGVWNQKTRERSTWKRRKFIWPEGCFAMLKYAWEAVIIMPVSLSLETNSKIIWFYALHPELHFVSVILWFWQNVKSKNVFIGKEGGIRIFLCHKTLNISHFIVDSMSSLWSTAEL